MDAKYNSWMCAVGVIPTIGGGLGSGGNRNLQTGWGEICAHTNTEPTQNAPEYVKALIIKYV